MLTDRQIQSAIKAVTTETTLNDGASGRRTGSLKLVIRRGANGIAASWFASWKTDGKRQKKLLGRYPEISLQTARQMHQVGVTTVLQAGKNPRTARLVAAPTVGALFEAYCDHLEAEGTRTIREIRRVLLGAKENCADGIGRSTLAGEIAPADVAAYLARAFNRGARRQADIQRTMMAAAFNWGIKSTHDYRTDKRGDWGIKFNPVTMVPKDAGASRARERNLTAAELAKLWAGMSDNRFSLEVSAAVRLIICCGQRVRETLRADGRDFDLVAGTWNMPAEKTKGGKPHTLPLPPQAVQIVQELIATHGMGPLFPSRHGAASPTILDTSLNHALQRWNAGAGLDPFITRDLRRTWKSRTADAGIARDMRDLIQQHAKSDTGSKHYDRADYLPQMREAMRKWGVWLDENVTNGKVNPHAQAA